MTSLELLQEIDAWLSFNNSPSKEQISELRKSIKEHLTEQLHIQDGIKLVCSCGRREKNVLSGICDICWNEKFPDEQTVL